MCNEGSLELNYSVVLFRHKAFHYCAFSIYIVIKMFFTDVAPLQSTNGYKTNKKNNTRQINNIIKHNTINTKQS
jgi:hypothetical protein